MATIIDTLITQVKFETDTTGLEQGVQSVQRFAVRAAAAITAAFVGTTGLIQVVNQSTREMANLAQAVGITTQEFQAYAQVSRQLGLQQDVVIDLIEEMNNKLGETRGLGEAITPVTEALQILGLELQDIENLNSAEQFQRIASAINELPDAQQAASAADILFGGEANRFFSFLKATGQSLDDILLQYSELNFLTDRGVEGAQEFTSATDRLSFAMGSLGREVAGTFGATLVPAIESFTALFVDVVSFVQDNSQFFEIFAVSVAGVATSFALLSTAIRAAAVASLQSAAAFLANPIFLIPAAIIAISAALALLIDDFIAWRNGAENVFGGFFQYVSDLVDGISEKWNAFTGSLSSVFGSIGNFLGFDSAPVTTGGNSTVSNRNTSVSVGQIEINAPNADSTEIAANVRQSLEEQIRNATQDFDSGIVR